MPEGKWRRRLIAAGLTLALALPPSFAKAADWLVLLVDVSGSITDTNYHLQKQGYVEALRDENIRRALQGTQVAIIEFASVAEVAVPFTDAVTAGERYAALPRPWQGNTNVSGALEAALDLLSDKRGVKVVDISSDGAHNGGVGDFLWRLKDRARAEFVEVNSIVLPSTEENLYDWYRKNVSTGFTMEVTDWHDFGHAIKQKIKLEISHAD